jgi:hypothetical protein
MKKIGFLALALVLALGALGVGYALWQDTVTITGEVNTGNLILGVKDIGTNDPADPPTADPQCGNGHNEEQKDVAYFVSVNGTLKEGCPGYYADITETFNHVYPYYGPMVTVEIKNCGSVPLRITGMTLTNFSGVDLTPWMSFVWTIWDEDGNPHPGSGDWWAFVAALGTPQIRGGGSIIIEKTICFEEYDAYNNLLPQNATMSYTLTVTGAQWNEVVVGP